MDKILRRYLEMGCCITHRHGEYPTLLLIGIKHQGLSTHGLNRKSPKDLFIGTKPDYCFLEGISAYHVLDLAEYQALRKRFKPIEPSGFVHEGVEYHDLGPTARGSFEEYFVYGFLKPNQECTSTELQWILDSPKTTFAGIDLPYRYEESQEIVGLALEARQVIEKYIASIQSTRKLSYYEQGAYDSILRTVGNVSNLLTAYGVANIYIKLQHDIPVSMLEELGVRSLINAVEERTAHFHSAREQTMGKTIANLIHRNRVSLALVGAEHIRGDSHIFPLLDQAGLEYIALDISKDKAQG